MKLMTMVLAGRSCGRPVKLTTLILAGTFWLALTGCAAGERMGGPRPTAVRSERDIYAAHARLDPAALRAWESASRHALRSGLEIVPSFRERIRFPDGAARAIAYRFTMVRGQSLRVNVVPVEGTDEVFADVFHHMGGDVFRPVHWADGSGGRRRLVARTTGEYVLRLQLPAGRDGTYDVAVLGDVSLRFPVAGTDASSIGSVFGDPRDGGARAHEGVDIFAARGTAVLAVANGRIQTSQNTPTGGLVIWQADEAGELTYYYAHLDELLVRAGTFVRAGETIGRVGNTGNARGVRPHLHFAVYRPGRIPLDPAPLLTGTVRADDARIDGRRLGMITRATGERVHLRRSPSHGGSVITELSGDTPLLVIGDAGEWQRVVLPDGTTGFVAERLTEPAH